MSRDRIATWGPDGPDLIHPGRPEVRVVAARGCAPKDYRRDRPQEVRFAKLIDPDVPKLPQNLRDRRVDRASQRPYRVVPKGGPRNLLRIFAAERARALVMPRIGR